MEPVTLQEIEHIQKLALDLIKKAETAEAITLLTDYLENKDFELYTQLVLLSNSFSDARKKVILVGGSTEEETLIRVTYNIIQFIGNLKLDLIQNKKAAHRRTEKPSFSSIKWVAYIGMFLMASATTYFFINWPKNDIPKPISSTPPIPMTVFASNLQHNEFPLLFQIDNSTKLDTIIYPIHTIIAELKNNLLYKYSLDTLPEYTTIYSKTKIKEVARWVIFVGSKPIPESDEFLSLQSLSELGKIIPYSVFRLEFIRERDPLADASPVEQTDPFTNISFIRTPLSGAKLTFGTTLFNPNEHQQWSQFHSIADVSLVSGIMVSQNHDDPFPFFSEKFFFENPLGWQIEKASATKWPADRKKYQFDLYNEFGLKEENIIEILSDEENDSWILGKMKRLVQI